MTHGFLDTKGLNRIKKDGYQQYILSEYVNDSAYQYHIHLKKNTTSARFLLATFQDL